MYCAERDVLLSEHFRLQRDINDIQRQIRKLEKTNELLDQQNRELKLELQSRYGYDREQGDSQDLVSLGNSVLSKFLDRQFLADKFNKASEICEVATGEIMKHAKCVADGVAYKLLNTNLLTNSLLSKGVLSGNPLSDSLSNSLVRNSLLVASSNPQANTFRENSLSKVDSMMGETVTTNLSSNETSEDAPLVMSSDEEALFLKQAKHTGHYEFH